MAGLSGQPEYPAQNEISGPKIRPGYWVTPILVLSRFSGTSKGVRIIRALVGLSGPVSG
jgi:hypothetical protein